MLNALAMKKRTEHNFPGYQNADQNTCTYEEG
jgi:hypothetical protein